MHNDNVVRTTRNVEVNWTSWFDYPKLVAEEITEYSNIDIIEEDLGEGGIHAAKSWRFWFQYLHEQWKTSLQDEIVQFCSGISEPRVLSLGCGYGGLELEIARSLKSPYEITAVDLNPNILTKARARAETEKLNIRFLPVDLNYVELKENSFDVVMAWASLHHILNLEHIFHQIYKSLKSGGRLIIRDIIGKTQVLFWKENVEFAIDLLRKMPAKYSAGISIPPYSEPHIQAGMEGIRQEEIEPLLKYYFVPIKMFKYGSFMRMICVHPGGELGKRFDPDIEADRQYLLSIFELDVRQVEEGRLRPTEMLAVYVKRASVDIDTINTEARARMNLLASAVAAAQERAVVAEAQPAYRTCLLVDFSANGQSDPWLDYGWGSAEPTLRWAINAESKLIIPPGIQPQDMTLHLNVYALVSPPIAAQRLTLSVDSHDLQQFVLGGGEAECICKIPAHLIKADAPIIIIFRHPDGARPCDLGLNSDDRILSIAFRRLSIHPLEDLIPPVELLLDGSQNIREFKFIGEGFTRKFLIERALLKPYERVLDLGSGIGRNARALTAYLDARGSYEGLDIVKKAVDWCQTHYSRFPNFRFQWADIYSSEYNPTSRISDTEYVLPFTDGDFDLVFLASVFTHMMPDGVVHYISEISRVLKPNGRCVATFFLLDPDTTKKVEAGKTVISFPYEIDGCRVMDDNNYAAAVALDNTFVHECFRGVGLRIVEVKLGNWSGCKDIGEHLQDLLIAIK
jgi:ubiquinone/menaquinone biosynthesis C-methylase UbiE